MKLVFYGSRGSYTTGVSPQRIESYAKAIFDLSRKKPRLNWKSFKKLIANEDLPELRIHSPHTTCVEIRSHMAAHPIYLDMGTGLSAAAADSKSGLNNSAFKKQNGEVSFFLSHTHWDHVIALPTLSQLYKGDNKFHIYGCHANLERRIQKLFDRDFFPVSYSAIKSKFQFHTLKKHEAFLHGKLSCIAAPQSHPGTSYAYRFEEDKKSFVFATDTDLANTFRSNYSKDYNIYASANILALDAHYTHDDFMASKDFGHPSVNMAVDFAVKNSVRHLLLIHHNPHYDDKKLVSVLKFAQHYLKIKHGSHPLKISLPREGDTFTL